MRILAISDLHGHLPELQETELLLIGGDICPVRDHSLKRQEVWLWDEFRPWLERAPAEKIVGVAGNHDFVAEDNPSLMYDLPWEYLCDESVEYGEHVIHGTPWTPTFGPWAFMGEEDDLAVMFKKIPDSTTILLSHGPMAGYGGFTDRGIDAGSTSLRKRVEDLKCLRFHAFGHIHEAFGDTERYPQTGWVLHSNVSFVDLQYRPRPLAELRHFEF